MELKGKNVLVLGGAGLVGLATARRILDFDPRRLVVGSLRREEAEEAVEELRVDRGSEDVRIDAVWGDIFAPEAMARRKRGDVMDEAGDRRSFIDDLYGELTDEVFRRSYLGRLLADVRPHVVVDSVNTAGALAYQDAFRSAEHLRKQAEAGRADREAVERHLSSLYLPQLIRHVQIALEGMKRAGTQMYVKIGTAGTGGMGLNIPFTHSEERPSRVLLAKAGLAGAHSLLLFLMGRTPGAPAVKEVKPTAAISWKAVEYGAIRRGGAPLQRVDAVEAVPVEAAFPGGGRRPEGIWEEVDAPLEGVYLDAGENGLFSLSEFEALTALGLMEFVTPEEIAEAVVREIEGRPTGRDTVAAMDAATLGPTYRAGVLRTAALRKMEAMEEETGVEGVAYEMLGPPRLSKLLFEGAILRRVHETVAAGATLDPEGTAEASLSLVEEDPDLRQRIVSIGLPILLPDGERVLRGDRVKVPPEGPAPSKTEVDGGWVDLRAENWKRWRSRLDAYRRALETRPSVEKGSAGDHDHGDDGDEIRPGRMAAWIFRYEDRGERIKR